MPEVSIHALLLDPEALRMARPIVDRVLREWGEQELNPLLSFVYFHTEPMANAHRGQALDFSRIQRRDLLQQPAAPPAMSAQEHLDELRARFQSAKAARRRPALEPKPRIDAVYEATALRVQQSEMTRLPSGEADLSEEAKSRLRANPPRPSDG